MATYRERRDADIALMRGARRIARDRNFSRRTRRAARKTAFAFSVRVALRWHDPADGIAKVLSGGFRWGRYGGVGHGIPAGEYRRPYGKLDRLYLQHDYAFATKSQRIEFEICSVRWRNIDPIAL